MCGMQVAVLQARPHMLRANWCAVCVRLFLCVVLWCGCVGVWLWACGESRFKKIYTGKSQLHTQHIPRGITGEFDIMTCRDLGNGEVQYFRIRYD